MNKKQIFKLGIISILIMLIAYVIVFFEPVKNENIMLSFEMTLDGNESDVVQIFYLHDETDDFTEENSWNYLINKGEKTQFSFDMKDIERFRIDFGTTEGTAEIENIKFSMGIFSKEWTKTEWESIEISSGISKSDFKDGTAVVKSISEDPYIIWDVDSFDLENNFKEMVAVSNLIIKSIVTLALVSILFVFVKKFNFFVEFPTEIWQSKGMLIQLAKNDFRTRFAGSYLGVIWAFIQPIVTVLVYWFVFEKGLRSGEMLNVPFVLWLIAGIVPWFFFQDALNAGTNALLEYQYLVKKVVFQINILPLVKVLSNFFVHIVFLVFALILYATYGMFPDLYTVQVLYYSFCTLVLVLGLCYATSALVGFFRDLSQIIGIVLQVGVWMTPIMWNMETMNLPEVLKLVLKANPMYYIVSGYRDALINKVWFWENMGGTIYFWIVTVIVLGAGMIIFKRLKPHFADVL